MTEPAKAEQLFLKKYGNKITASESWVIRFAEDFAEESNKELRDQLAIQENYNDMLVSEIAQLKSEEARKFKEWENQRKTIGNFHDVFRKHFPENYADSANLDILITQLKEVNDKLKIGFDKAINRHIQTSLKLQEQVSELKSKLEVAESKSVGKFLDFAGGEYGGLATYTINKAVANFLTKINN